MINRHVQERLMNTSASDSPTTLGTTKTALIPSISEGSQYKVWYTGNVPIPDSSAFNRIMDGMHSGNQIF